MKEDWIHPKDYPLPNLTPEKIKQLTEQYKVEVESLATKEVIYSNITYFW